ncbi:hypothetical protein BDF20DRAFT_831610 [Mycotypha africana]|uniref:uncharacterized protein n=1 Tax=Mycotypha africana TaxID=64632 RepID=UPI00230131D3|nr:uncharacterized protein BDF20DRAFT_831610 [Mycotypha africana]KAI8991582.1 hypothetical protein BDF20DRAFT_831610 [Mycotypha africana]
MTQNCSVPTYFYWLKRYANCEQISAIRALTYFYKSFVMLISLTINLKPLEIVPPFCVNILIFFFIFGCLCFIPNNRANATTGRWLFSHMSPSNPPFVPGVIAASVLSSTSIILPDLFSVLSLFLLVTEATSLHLSLSRFLLFSLEDWLDRSLPIYPSWQIDAFKRSSSSISNKSSNKKLLFGIAFARMCIIHPAFPQFC